MDFPDGTVFPGGETYKKRPFPTIQERNRTFERILTVIRERKSFLLLGHVLPDEDCIASLVTMALLLDKFGKDVVIYLSNPIPNQLSYLSNICCYNNIHLLIGSETLHHEYEVICVLDTPKPDMISLSPAMLTLLREERFIDGKPVPIIEFDHHLSADAEYSGTAGYRFVHFATSTCELLALFCHKLETREGILREFEIKKLFSRNIVLAMLTGMIGDTKNGLTLKKNRDIFFYKLFTTRFSSILEASLRKNTANYASTHDIFSSIQLLTVVEKDIYHDLLSRARYSGRTGYVTLTEEESTDILARTEYNIFVKAIKSVTDNLAEKSGVIGMTSYYDPAGISDLVQFRIRTARDIGEIDLRTILADFSIADGGGHPGAIGFRVPKASIGNGDEFVSRLLKRLEEL